MVRGCDWVSVRFQLGSLYSLYLRFENMIYQTWSGLWISSALLLSPIAVISSLWFIYLVWNFDQWRPLRVRRCGSYIEFVTSVIRYFFLFIVAGVPLTASIISTGVICTFYTTLVRVEEVQSIVFHSFVPSSILPSISFIRIIVQYLALTGTSCENVTQKVGWAFI